MLSVGTGWWHLPTLRCQPANLAAFGLHWNISLVIINSLLTRACFLLVEPTVRAIEDTAVTSFRNRFRQVSTNVAGDVLLVDTDGGKAFVVCFLWKLLFFFEAILVRVHQERTGQVLPVASSFPWCAAQRCGWMLGHRRCRLWWSQRIVLVGKILFGEFHRYIGLFFAWNKREIRFSWIIDTFRKKWFSNWILPISSLFIS